MEELCTKNQTNPWLVEELEEFLYFCCPECDEKCRAKDLFLKHAFCQHPNVSYICTILFFNPNFLIPFFGVFEQNYNSCIPGCSRSKKI